MPDPPSLESGPQESPNTSSTTPAQQVSTGNFWTDFGLAVKNINVSQDISNIGQIPCARNSLLGGIASGVGVGVIRGMSAGPRVACNWAVGTFVFVSLGAWHICRRQVANEHKRMQVLVNSLPRLRQRRPEELEKEEHE